MKEEKSKDGAAADNDESGEPQGLTKEEEEKREKERIEKEQKKKAEEERLAKIKKNQDDVLDYYRNGEIIEYILATNRAGKSHRPLVAGCAMFNEKD